MVVWLASWFSLFSLTVSYGKSKGLVDTNSKLVISGDTVLLLERCCVSAASSGVCINAGILESDILAVFLVDFSAKKEMLTIKQDGKPIELFYSCCSQDYLRVWKRESKAQVFMYY